MKLRVGSSIGGIISGGGWSLQTADRWNDPGGRRQQSAGHLPAAYLPTATGTATCDIFLAASFTFTYLQPYPYNELSILLAIFDLFSNQSFSFLGLTKCWDHLLGSLSAEEK